MKTWENALQQVTQVFPSDARNNRYLWKEYMPHALRLLENELLDPMEKSELGFLAGWCLQADGRTKDAIKLLEHVVEVEKTTLDEGHPDQLASQHELARAYQADGRVKDAIKLLEHVVEVWEITLDEGHPDRLTSQQVLASAYQADGRVKDAIKLLEHVVEVRKTTLDEGHPDRLASQHELASAYQADGQVKDGYLRMPRRDESKSQMAIHFAHEVHATSPETSIFWVHGSTKATFEESYCSIANVLKLPRRHDPDINILALVCNWVQREDELSWRRDSTSSLNSYSSLNG